MTRLSLSLAVAVASFPALAQEPRRGLSVEQLVASEIGQCVLQRSSLTVENEMLKAKVRNIEAMLADPKPAKPE